MTTRKIFAALLALAIFCGFASCTARNSNTESISVYFLTEINDESSGSAVAAVQINVSPHADKVTAAMRTLLSGSGGYKSPFSGGVKLLSVRTAGESVTIGLSEEFGGMSGAELAAAEACTALTLCEIVGVSEVKLTVNGEAHPLGSKDFLTAQSIVIGDLSLKPMEHETVIYFSDGDAKYVVAETRNIVIRENEALERYVIEEMIKGPDGEGLSSVLPRGTQLINIVPESGICLVNFTAEFGEILTGAVDLEIQAIAAVTNTLCALEGIDGVQYLVEGERIYSIIRECAAMSGAFTDNTMDAQMYMPSRDGDKLVKITARVRTGGGFEWERLVVEKMITGVDGSGFMSPIPPGTRLNSLELKSGVCVVDFTKEFVENDSGKISQAMLEQILALTLVDSCGGVDSVEILVDGEEYSGVVKPNREIIEN